jgi:hypothetical protein
MTTPYRRDDVERRVMNDRDDIPLVTFTTTGNGYVDVWVAGQLVHSEYAAEDGRTTGRDQFTADAIARALARVTAMGCLDD